MISSDYIHDQSQYNDLSRLHRKTLAILIDAMPPLTFIKGPNNSN